MSDVVKFAVVVDGEVISNISYRDEHPSDRIIAALRTGPVYVEIEEEVEIGSTWDGTSFTPPVE